MKELKRVNMNIPVDLLERVDAWADDKGVDRTTAFRLLAGQALDQERALSDMSNMLEMMKKMNASLT